MIKWILVDGDQEADDSYVRPAIRSSPGTVPTVRNHPTLMSLAPSNTTAASLARRVRAPTPPSLRALLAPKSRERRASVALLSPEPLALLPPRTRRRAAVALRALWSNRFDPRLAAAPQVRPADGPSVAAGGSCEAPRAPWSCCRATDACLGRRTTSPSLYWRLRCLLADAHKYRRNTPRSLSGSFDMA